MNPTPIQALFLELSIFFGLIVLFYLGGRACVDRLMPASQMPFVLRVALGVPIGSAIYLSCLCVLNLLLANFRVSVFFASVITLIPWFLRGANNGQKDNSLNSFKVYWLLCFLAVVVFSLTSITTHLPLGDYLNANPGISLIELAHSLRAGNISIWIDENNIIPRANQNLAQSVFATIPAIVGIKSPQLALTIWHGITNWLLLSTMAVWLYYYHRLGIFATICAILLACVANAALSFHYIAVMDVGSTIALKRSADISLSLTYLLLSVILAEHWFSDRSSKITLLLLFVLCIALNVTGAHFLVLLIPFLFVLFEINSWLTHSRRGLGRIYISLVCGAAIGALCGGMLTPSGLISHEFIPGLSAFQGSGKVTFEVKQFYFNGYTPYLSLQDKGYIGVSYAREIDRLDALLSIRFVFFPLLGFFLALVMTFRKGFQVNGWSIGRTMIPAAFVVFVGMGTILASSVVLNGHVWEMSRFLHPAVFLGILFFSICVVDVFTTTTSHISKIALAVLVLVCIWGPLTEGISIRLERGMKVVTSSNFWGDGGGLAAVSNSNQVACGGWLPGNYDEKDYQRFCKDRP
jgi:hypothetical protein